MALADFACDPCFGHVAAIRVRRSHPVALASSNSMDTTALSIYEQLVQACSGTGDRLLTAAQIKALLAERFGTNPASVLPSDFCYNRWNQGSSRRKPLFVRVGTGEYRYVGPDHPYTGVVLWRPKGATQDQVAGEWIGGELRLYGVGPDATEFARHDIAPPVAPASQDRSVTIPLSSEQLDRLYEEYMGILDLEVGAFGCKPTETRHLIGRLGEFYCARLTVGQLAQRVNQEGFDVVGADGRRISVKTTAQKTGFVSLNANTLDRAEDLMILRYSDGAFDVVYHGEIGPAVEAARPWEGRFELDLSKARRIAPKTQK